MSKIFVGPVEIAGFYSKLAEGLRSLGFDVDFFTMFPHPFGYGQSIPSPLLLRVGWLWAPCFSSPSPTLGEKVISQARRVLVAAAWLLWSLRAIFSYQCFIFSFGKSFWPGNWDLVLLRLLRKRVICCLGHGSEARIPYTDGVHQHLNAFVRKDAKRLRRLTRRNLHAVKMAERYASFIIGSPLSTSGFATKPFINRQALGHQISTQDNSSEVLATPLCSVDEEVFVLHAPSNRQFKGTMDILSVVRRLPRGDTGIRFSVEENVSHDVIRKSIDECHVVLDQLYSDIPLSSLGSEAADAGKAVLVGGYGLQLCLDTIPEDVRPPVFCFSPDQLDSTLRELINNPSVILERGNALRYYMQRICSPSSVAKKYAKILSGQPDPSWWVDPADILYLEGAGQSWETTQRQIRGLVKLFGVSALGLDHKPMLLAAYLRHLHV